MIKMNLYFDDAYVDTCYAANIEEAYYMKNNLSGFWDMNECCIEHWFNELKRPFEPKHVNLFFDMDDKETKCWIIFDKICSIYSYDYAIINNTIIMDSGIAKNIGLNKIGKNDMFNGHFEYSTIEEALIEWIETMEATNKGDKEEGNHETWRENIIEFIFNLIPKKSNIESKDIEELNDILKTKGCVFKFQFKKDENNKNIAKIVPLSDIFLLSSILNINDDCYNFINNFFKKKGVELQWNNTGRIFWAEKI